LEVSELIDDLRERLRPFRARMFPRQLLLELTDTRVVGQPLINGRPQPVCIDVTLPSLTLRDGLPIEIEPLADLVGDLLVRDGLIDAYVMAALPDVAVDWRVINWADKRGPEDGEAELRRLEPDLGLAYPLSEAALDVRPLPGAPGQALLAVTTKEVVNGWIEVFHQAGTNLDRLACPQSCRLAALGGELLSIPPHTLVVAVSVNEEGGHLQAIRDGVPLFAWPLPASDTAQVSEARRCLDFLQEEFPGERPPRLLLEGPLERQTLLETTLDLPSQRIDCAPYGSLVLRGLAIPDPIQ
jgi:hypothetical protein